MTEVSTKKNGKAEGGARRPEEWTAQERLEALAEASRLAGEELGEYLRRQGLHEETLQEWRQAALEALQPTTTSVRSSDQRHIRRLEKELARKEKALAEAATLLVLKKKAQELWGDEDDDTNESTDKPLSGWSIKG